MSLKVCQISTVHSHFDTRIFYKECKSLVENGYDVYFIVTHNKEEKVDGVSLIPLEDKPGRVYRVFVKDFIALKKALKVNALIYHFHDPELIFVGLILKILGKKVVYDVHEDVPEQIMSKTYIPGFLRKLISKTFNFFEKAISSYFDGVVVATETIQGKFIKWNKNTVVIKNYPIVEMIKSRDKYDVKEYLDLIFVGGIYDERAIVELVKAMHESKNDTRLTLIGSCNNDYLNEIKQADFKNKVTYYNFMDYNKVVELICKADIGYLCDYPLIRHMESLPIKMFEYMAAGIPMIVSDFPLWREIVANYCGVCVDPLNPKDIAKAIDYYAENPKKVEEYGKNGLKASREKYSWELEKDKLFNLYSKIV